MQPADGDIIEIGDDGTYNEDVTVSPFLAAVGHPRRPSGLIHSASRGRQASGDSSG